MAGDEAYSAVYEIRNRTEVDDKPSGKTDAGPARMYDGRVPTTAGETAQEPFRRRLRRHRRTVGGYSPAEPVRRLYRRREGDYMTPYAGAPRSGKMRTGARLEPVVPNKGATVEHSTKPHEYVMNGRAACNTCAYWHKLTTTERNPPGASAATQGRVSVVFAAKYTRPMVITGAANTTLMIRSRRKWLRRASIDRRNVRPAPARPGRIKPDTFAGQATKDMPVDDERKRDDHLTFWTGSINASGWPADVKQHAVAALEARGPFRAATALIAVATCDGWQGVPAPYKAVLRTLLESASRPAGSRERERYCWVMPGTCNATIGGTRQDGTGWRQPTLEVDTCPEVIPISAIEHTPVAPTVARGLAFAGCMGFVRGPKAAGKTTVLAAAAARVTRGESFAGRPTIPGPVLLVLDDDPRSWSIRTRMYGADLDRVLTVPARNAARSGAVAALIAKHRPIWIIIDNWRTWLRALQVTPSDPEGAATAIDPLGEAVRGADYPAAITIVHNEARSKDGDGYAGRLRDSTVFEDAADWIIGISHDGAVTRLSCGPLDKSRVGIPTETDLRLKLSASGHAAAVEDSPPPAIVESDDGQRIAVPIVAGWVLKHIPPGESRPRNAIIDAAGRKQQTTVRALGQLVTARVLTVSGNGKRGSPYTYHRPTESSGNGNAVLSPPENGNGNARDSNPPNGNACGTETDSSPGFESQYLYRERKRERKPGPETIRDSNPDLTMRRAAKMKGRPPPAASTENPQRPPPGVAAPVESSGEPNEPPGPVDQPAPVISEPAAPVDQPAGPVDQHLDSQQEGGDHEAVSVEKQAGPPPDRTGRKIRNGTPPASSGRRDWRRRR